MKVQWPQISICRQRSGDDAKGYLLVRPQSYPGFSTIWLEAVLGLGVAQVVKLGNNGGEEHECGSCPKYALPQGLARGGVLAKYGPILGVVRVPDESPE